MSKIKQNPVTGKYYVEFDEIPTLLFISPEGHGSTDSLFIDGQWQARIHDCQIRCDVEKLTEYSLNAYAIKL